MKTRLFSSAVLLPLLLIAVWFLPKIVTALVFGVLAAFASYELLQPTGLCRHPRLVVYSMVISFLVSLWSYSGCSYPLMLIGILAFYGALFAEVLASHVKLQFHKIAACMAAGLLIPYLLTSLVRIHGMEEGRIFIMVPFIMAFVSDSGAYFVGRAYGKHKLAPAISPNKTIEGAVGGVVAAMAVMCAFAAVLQFGFRMEVNYLYALLYGFAGSLGSVFGDLCLSVIKRQTGIKDYGNLIPGHGGVLDRFDSMLVAGPVAEVLLLLLPFAI